MIWNWFASWRDQRSLKAHRNVLGHLQHVATEDRKPTTHIDGELIPHVRVLEPDPSDPAPVRPAAPPRLSPGPTVVTRRPRRPAPAREASGRPVSHSDPVPGSTSPPKGRPVVFVDDATPTAGTAPAAPAARRHDPPVVTPDRPVGATRRARPGRGIRLGAAAGVVAAAAVVGVVLATAGGGHRAPAPRVAAPVPSTTSVPKSTPATAPPATAQPAALVPTSTGTEAATYTVGASSVQMSLSASRLCWVELRAMSESGPLLYEGVLTAGTARTFQANGLWLRLGYPAGVTLNINGSPVALPTDGSPFDVTVDGSSPT